MDRETVSSAEFLIDFMHKRCRLKHQPSNLLLADLHQWICTNFHLDRDQYFLEIFDQRYELYIILDQFYLGEIQTNPRFKNIHSYQLRIRLTNNEMARTHLHRSFESSEVTNEVAESHGSVSKHIVVWLDAYIAYPENNRQLKEYFSIITSTQQATPTLWEELGINNLIAMSVCDEMNINKQNKTLRMFKRIDSCVNFIENFSQSNTKIFLVTTGSLGRKLVPRIYENQHIHGIYVFTCCLAYQIDWVIDFLDKIIVFEHELDLLSRITRDIASYYVQRAFEPIEDCEKSLNYLSWSKKLFGKADLVDQFDQSVTKLKQIDKYMYRIEQCIDDRQRNLGEIKCSVECDG
ncbi:unnamed protein product [Adineta ricciae]|uniref:Uncharacterized protein n=1 Tax=Adineta ricciae TaxID=249248 RepID=A0A815GHS6_ADIRI|nr:unnamed protein product [Adineta ricciae]CAF1338708.1 unnamed protein product [Adineta ricciae]